MIKTNIIIINYYYYLQFINQYNLCIIASRPSSVIFKVSKIFAVLLRWKQNRLTTWTTNFLCFKYLYEVLPNKIENSHTLSFVADRSLNHLNCLD